MIFGLLLVGTLVCPPKTDKVTLEGRERCAKQNKPLEGTHVIKHPGGLPAMSLSFKAGLPHGKWVFSRPNGLIDVVEEYREGELDGKTLAYSGKEVVEEKVWSRGKNIGPNTLYYPGGKKAVVETFGEGAKQAIFLPDGTLFSGEGLPAEIISLVMRAAQLKFQFCYEQRLAETAQLQGKVSVYFKIGTSGAVTHPRIEETSLRDVKTEKCLLKVLTGLRFPRPNGEPLEISFPMVFTPT